MAVRNMLGPGAEIPPCEFVGLDGGRVVLRPGPQERASLLVFFKVSCPTCQLALPFLDRLAPRAGGRVDVYLISQDEPEVTQAFLLHFGISSPACVDSEGDGYPASNAFGIRHVPSLFWVNTEGRIDEALHGFHREDYAKLGARAGVSLFHAGEAVPDWRAG